MPSISNLLSKPFLPIFRDKQTPSAFLCAKLALIVPLLLCLAAPINGARAAKIAASYNHTCAVTMDGGVICWGTNAQGQLGNSQLGTAANESRIPVTADGLPSGSIATAVAVGGYHSCALLQNGQVWCWGEDSSGQRGDGDIDNDNDPLDADNATPQPVQLPAGAVASAIAAGESHTCAIVQNGALWCWGLGGYGQLGGDTDDSPVPVAVKGIGGNGTLTGMADIAAGYYHTCAVRGSNGHVLCWGSGANHQLGTGNTSSQPMPVEVPGLSGIASLSSGSGRYHQCARSQAGALWCWGENSTGPAGNGTTNDQSTPGAVSFPSSAVTAVAVGAFHTCAADDTGKLYCWGENNERQLGQEDHGIDFLSPTEVPNLVLADGELALGYSHSCLRSANGDIRCWGANYYNGELGIDVPKQHPLPQPVIPLNLNGASVSGLSAGDDYTCALLSDKTLRCWGRNGYGQLGDNTQIDRMSPVQPSGFTTAAMPFDAGSRHICATASSLLLGGVKCWGEGVAGKLGNGDTDNRSAPTDVMGLDVGFPASITRLSAGGSHTCAIANNEARCWGRDDSGQLGDGIQETNPGGATSPVKVATISIPEDLTDISAGSVHTCAVTETGKVWCWGQQQYGRLGNGASGPGIIPAPVQADFFDASTDARSATRIGAGNAHTCALSVDGNVRCWGAENSGQLGNGGQGADTLTSPPINPVDVSGMSTDLLAVGNQHNCVSGMVANPPKIYCWGNNHSGEIGNNTFNNAVTPVPVQGLPSASGLSVVALAAGNDHTCAAFNDNQIWCWGDNHYGQLGNGEAGSYATPQDVLVPPAQQIFKDGFE